MSQHQNIRFVKEQGFPADIVHDAQDRTTLYFLALLDGHSAGTARVLMQDDRTVLIGRVAVLCPHRRFGVDRRLMATVEESAELKLIETFLVPFYQRLGYEPFGEEFISEAGKRARHIKKKKPSFRKTLYSIERSNRVPLGVGTFGKVPGLF